MLLLLNGIFIFTFKKWLGPLGTFYCSVFILALTLTLTLNDLYSILLNGNYCFIDFGRWFFCLDLIDSHLIFCADSLALTCASLVIILTILALYFGVEYMSREAFINRLLYLLNLFATSVVFLFFCYDFFLIMLSWECIGLFSMLLVNFYSNRVYTIKAALKTFVFSRVSDMLMFFSFILVVNTFNSTDLSLIFVQIPFFMFHYVFFGTTAIHFLTLLAACLSTSGLIKAAQIFFHVWLPDAMEAPTPASALIHSSTLVVAGIFLIIRFSILFEFAILVNYYLTLVGAATLVFGAITATFQYDIKKLVAYSTISQIGYLVCGCGYGCYDEVLIYLIIHALNKAFLFILVGYIVHFFSGNTDMRQMGGLYIYALDITVLLFSVCFNLAGSPYSSGFFSKELLLTQILRDDLLSYIVRAAWLISFFFTPIYMFSLIFNVMFGIKKGSNTLYLHIWNIDFYRNARSLIINKWTTRDNNITMNSLTRFQFTLVNSRTTGYILFLFWMFFSNFGEFLLLMTSNFGVLTDLINSHYFLTVNSNLFYTPNLLSNTLAQITLFFIEFALICGFINLLTFKYKSIYKPIEFISFLDKFVIIFLIVYVLTSIIL